MIISMRTIAIVLTLVQLAVSAPLAAWLLYLYSIGGDKKMLFGGLCGLALCILLVIHFFF